jgi:flagellar biosynthesis regulator FlaF
MNAGMRDIEDRIGVGNVEHHIARFLKLSREVAPLRAVHGPGGTFDPQRKANVSTIKMRVRAEAVAAGSKLTVDEIDAIAHADDQYVAFITQATTDRTRMAELEAELEAIQFLINREQAAIRYSTVEPR